MRARKSALSSQSGNLLFMFAMGFNLLWSCWGFVVMVSNRESDRKGKRMTEKQRIEKTAGEKAPMFVIWEFFDDVCYYQATELTFDHSHCTMSTFFRWCVFLLFDKNHLFFRFYRLFTLSFIYQVGKYGIRVCHKSKFDIWDTGRVELVPFRLRYLVRSRAKWWFRVIGRLVLVLMLAQQHFVCRHEYVLFDNFRV